MPTRGAWTTLGPRRYRSWLLGELLLVCLLASGTALFAASDSLKSAYELHDARLAFDTAVAVVAAFVCVLTSVRFLVEGRTLDLLLAAGFWSIALGTVAFGLVPVLGGGSLAPAAAWQFVGARLLGAGLIAIAPFVERPTWPRADASLVSVGVGVAVLLVARRRSRSNVPEGGRCSTAELVEGSYVRLAARSLTALWLVALVGFGLRYRRYGRDLDSWMCLAATLAVFADLHLVLTPVVSSDLVLQGDFLARPRVRRAARRRLAGDRRGRVRARGRRRAGARRARHPRRPRAVPVRDLDAGQHARVRRAARAGAAAPQARCDVGAAGGAVRGSRALVGRRLGALRLGAAPVRRGPDRRRCSSTSSSTSTRRCDSLPTSRSRSSGSCRRGSATRAATRARATSRCRSRSAAGRRVVTVSDDGVGFDETARHRGPGRREHALTRRGDRRRAHVALASRSRDGDRGRAPPGLVRVSAERTAARRRSSSRA